MNASLQLPWPPETRFLHIGGLLVDLRYRQIRSPMGADLPPRLFDLLLLLMSEPHTLHTRTELFERLWPGLVVEDANLTQSVWLLRKALGEERKHWIRTVAKGGYVFEPPAPIEPWVDLPGESTMAAGSVETGSTIEPGDAPDELTRGPQGDEVKSIRASRPFSEGRRTGSKRLWLGIAAAFVGLALVVSLGTRLRAPSNAARASTPSPLTVALIRVEDPGNSAQWPTRLLYEWVKWKLGSLPEITLLTEADLAAGAGTAPAQIVFVATNRIPGKPERIALRARFQAAGKEQRIELEGESAQVPAMVDELSRQILQRLAPIRAAQPWPRLQVDERGARRYADLVQALDHRDWMTVAAVGNDVVAMSPRFGLARAQLAVAQSRLAQAALAIEQMDLATAELRPAPTDVSDLLHAQRLALDPLRQREAAAAYGALVARNPDQAAYVLEYAYLLVRSDRANDALPLLLALNRQQAPLGVRIARLLALGETYQALGDPKRMIESARAAERLASSAGPGWELESGAAQLLAASAKQFGPAAGADLFEQAARRLEHAGNRTAALYARFLGEVSGPPLPGADARLATLLAQANAGGYRDVEINILLHLGYQRFKRGDMVGYRQRLEEAGTIAEVSGNVGARARVDAMLLVDDILRARLPSADDRIHRLGKADLQGTAGLTIDRLAAAVASLRGDSTGATRILQRAERRLPAVARGDALSLSQAQLSCALAEQRLSLGELAAARTGIKLCKSAAAPQLHGRLLILDAMTEQLAGDSEAARVVLRSAEPALASMGNGPERWTLAIEAAALLTRLGETNRSDRLLNNVAAAIRSSGYSLIESMVEAGLAENAAARGDWAGSQRHIAAARTGLPNGLWAVESRLGILDAAAAFSSGDRARAFDMARKLHQEAHRLGDVRTQMEIHSLMPGELSDDANPRNDDLLVARTGMRGANIDWLVHPLKARRL